MSTEADRDIQKSSRKSRSEILRVELLSLTNRVPLTAETIETHAPIFTRYFGQGTGQFALNRLRYWCRSNQSDKRVFLFSAALGFVPRVMETPDQRSSKQQRLSDAAALIGMTGHRNTYRLIDSILLEWLSWVDWQDFTVTNDLSQTVYWNVDIHSTGEALVFNVYWSRNGDAGGTIDIELELGAGDLLRFALASAAISEMDPLEIRMPHPETLVGSILIQLRVMGGFESSFLIDAADLGSIDIATWSIRNLLHVQIRPTWWKRKSLL